MGFFDFLKTQKKSEQIDYDNDPLLKQAWKSHHFLFWSEKPSEVSEKEFLLSLQENNDKTLGYVLGQSVGIAELGKSVTIKSIRASLMPKEYTRHPLHSGKHIYYTLIRFPDLRKQEKGKTFYRRVGNKEARNYLFSPLQSLRSIEIMRRVEFALQAVYKLEPREVTIKLTPSKTDVLVDESDGLQYLSYPLSKRAELYRKYPELDEQLFGTGFVEFAEWIIEKGETSDHMRRVIKITKAIAKKYDIEGVRQ